MSDFTGAFWPFFVSAVTLLGVVGCALLLMSMSKGRVAADPEQTGHVWDEDLAEYNNPLPRWWIVLFWITIVFGLAYLAWYPGLGTWKGGGWTSVAQYEDEMRRAERVYGPIYQRFAAVDVASLARDPQARAAGEKLFLNNCAQCHASDAHGNKGFPNLTDGDWLYGGDPQAIEKTILDGRNGAMPAWGPVLKDEGVRDAANYVRSLSGLAHDAARTARGKTIFATYCVACHGADGKGNTALGAPNLTDPVWLYGSSEETVMESIARGRGGHMPAHRELLGEPRVHVLAAYVYGLSHPEPAQGVVPVAATR